MIWFILPILIAAVTLVLQFVVSFINSRQVGRVYKYLINDARQRSRRSFTIIITLSRRADTIMPLLDHLRAFNFTKLQVVVVIKQTAGSRAQRSLEAYRRKTGLKLTIVNYRRGLTTATLAGRYATGDYVMQIDSIDRLSSRFFDLVSQILYSTHASALVVRNHLRPRQTFLQAATSITYLFNGLGLVIGINRDKSRQHLIIKRKLLASGKEFTARPYLAEQVHIDMSTSQTKLVLSPTYLSFSAVIGALMIVTYYLIGRLAGPYEASIFAIALLTTLAICVVVLMASLRGYKLIDYIDMVLFVPLLPIYATYKLLTLLVVHSRPSRRRNYIAVRNIFTRRP